MESGFLCEGEGVVVDEFTFHDVVYTASVWDGYHVLRLFRERGLHSSKHGAVFLWR